MFQYKPLSFDTENLLSVTKQQYFSDSNENKTFLIGWLLHQTVTHAAPLFSYDMLM